MLAVSHISLVAPVTNGLQGDIPKSRMEFKCSHSAWPLTSEPLPRLVTFHLYKPAVQPQDAHAALRRLSLCWCVWLLKSAWWKDTTPSGENFAMNTVFFCITIASLYDHSFLFIYFFAFQTSAALSEKERAGKCSQSVPVFMSTWRSRHRFLDVLTYSLWTWCHSTGTCGKSVFFACNLNSYKELKLAK